MSPRMLVCWGAYAAAMAAASLVALVLATSPAAAYTSAGGYNAIDYATGFATSSMGWGPIGVAFDQSDNLYVGDPVDGNLYRFAPGGGAASSATLVGNLGQYPEGLAFAPDGALYAARASANDVVQVDLASGGVLRTVATGISCAMGLAVDPVSGDLFVSQNFCGNTIFRISKFRGGPGTKSTFASLANVDGIAFNSDGTLYANSAGDIYAIGGTASGAPGTATKIATVPQSDGLAFGATPPGGRLPFLVANRLDGVVTRVDFATQPSTTTDLFSGGTRGDFAAVDSKGCLYITQTDRILKIAPFDRACGLAPTTPGSSVQVASQAGLQCAKRKLTLIDVLKHGKHVLLLGAADRSLIGHTVSIYFHVRDALVARATVGADGFFRATGPLPPRSLRNTNLARYVARAGDEESLDLKFARRLIIKSIRSAGHTVTIEGRVTMPLAVPRAKIIVQRRVSCNSWITVTHVWPRPDGTFTAKVAAPPNDQAAVYRAGTFVRRNTRNPKLFPTFTLPRVVALD